MEPDTTEVFPISYEMIDPKGELAKTTLAWVERMWSQHWDFGGYPRYNTDSEPDPPGPWPLCSAIVAQAYLQAGDDEKVWRILNWLNGIHGGRSGGWFERYAQSITPPAPPVGVVPWVWYEIISLAIHHIAGFRPGLEGISLRPRLLSGVNQITLSQTVRGATYEVEIRRGGPKATVNGKPVAVEQGAIRIPYARRGSRVSVQLDV
jgi:hypothetical protein